MLYTVKSVINMLIVPFINSIIMSVLILLIKIYILKTINIGEFFIFILIGAAIYFVYIKILEKYFKYDIFKILKARIWEVL